MDKHLKSLAPRYLEAKVIKADAEISPFFVTKLGIKTLPCVILFRKGIAGDRLVGFQDQGGKDDFSTRNLEVYFIKKESTNLTAETQKIIDSVFDEEEVFSEDKTDNKEDGVVESKPSKDDIFDKLDALNQNDEIENENFLTRWIATPKLAEQSCQEVIVISDDEDNLNQLEAHDEVIVISDDEDILPFSLMAPTPKEDKPVSLKRKRVDAVNLSFPFVLIDESTDEEDE